MVGHYNHGVPTTVDLENNSNQKKYTVNRRPGGLVISKPLCVLMAIGALLLAVLVGLLVFFLAPRGGQAAPQSLTKSNCDDIISDELLSENSNHPLTSTNTNNNEDNTKEMDADERLPRSIEPTHYSLQVIPYLSNQTCNGSVAITLDVKAPTNEIIFNVQDIDINQESVRIFSAKSSTPLQIDHQDYIPGQKYRVLLAETLEKNVMYTLNIQYLCHLNNHLQGFYRSDYIEPENRTTVYMASTQFSPTDARRAFPCFDEPSFKATFAISISRPENLTSLSNMPLEKTYPDPERTGWFWDQYKTTPKMSTYLVAYIVSDLQVYGSSDKDFKLWSRKELMYESRYAAEFAPKVLHFLEDYFKIKFPLPKIDIAAIPDFGYNAMENWGLITFRESKLLFDEQRSSMSNKRDIATVLAHELGHQWFGNLVTPKWWDDLWLKEGFATYLQYLSIQVVEPNWNIQEEFIQAETSKAFHLDALETARPISFPVNNNRAIRQVFDGFSYSKGACIIKMMNHFLGEEAFKAGLISYLEKYQYANADQDELFAVLTEEAHKKGALDKTISVKDVMDSWTKKPGYPVVTVLRDKANKKLILSQKRFLYNGNINDNSTWWIPISIRTSDERDYGNTTPSVWLKNEPMVTVDFNHSDWYLLNVNQTGYFIVNYDEDNWRQLTYNIMYLSPLTRAQLISDSMDLARANLLPYDIPLKLIARMAIRDSQIMYVPTFMAFKKLGFLSNILASTAVFGWFEEFHSTIFKATYKTVDSNRDYYADDYLNQMIRKTVVSWACRKSGSECAIKSHHMFRAWMEKNIMVPPNLRDTVYCTAIREGTEAEWNFAYRKYLETTSVSEKNTLIDALGCTTRKWLLSRYLNFLVVNNTSIRIQDAARVFESVSKNNAIGSLAFDFLRTNWNDLVAHYGEGFNILSKMVKSLPRYMHTEYQLLDLIRFRKEVKNNIGTASKALDSAIEEVRANVEWMKKNYKTLERWFLDHKYNYNLL